MSLSWAPSSTGGPQKPRKQVSAVAPSTSNRASSRRPRTSTSTTCKWKQVPPRRPVHGVHRALRCRRRSVVGVTRDRAAMRPVRVRWKRWRWTEVLRQRRLLILWWMRQWRRPRRQNEVGESIIFLRKYYLMWSIFLFIFIDALVGNALLLEEVWRARRWKLPGSFETCNLLVNTYSSLFIVVNWIALLLFYS